MMKDVLKALTGKIIKIYLRNGQEFSARIMQVGTEIVYLRTTRSELTIRMSEIIVLSTGIEDPEYVFPTKNAYHP